MSKMKQLGIWFVAMAMGVSSLTGCSGGKETADKAPAVQEKAEGEKKEEKKEETEKGEPVTLRYWQHSSAARDEVMKELADQFMADNPNIKIEMEFIPLDSYTQKLIPSLASGTAPDVFQAQSGMINRLAKQGSIQALDTSVISAEVLDKEFIPSTVEALKVDGNYYGLPTDVQTIITFWNKDLLDEVGLDSEKGPQTWDEMREWARLLTKTENGQMVQSGWGHKGYNPEVQSIVAQYGGKFVDESGKYIFADDAKAIEAIKVISDSYRVDKVYNKDFMANWAGFRQGKVAMMLGHPAMIGNLKETAPDINYGVGTIPTLEGGEPITTVTSWGYVMSNNAQAKAATEFISFLASEEVQKMWTQKTGELPSRASLVNSEELAADPMVKVALESLPNSIVGSLQMGPLNDAWVIGYDKIMLTDESLESILKSTQDALNQEIAKDLK